MCMTTFQEISDHMTCHNECSDVISTHVLYYTVWLFLCSFFTYAYLCTDAVYFVRAPTEHAYR